MKRACPLFLPFSMIFLCCCVGTLAEANAPIHSIYTDRMDALAKNWPPSHAADWLKKLESVERPFFIQGVNTPGNETFIGLIQVQKIHAPLAKVFSTVEKYSEYTELFSDLLRSEVKERQGDRWIVASEQHIAVPFVPNERNEVNFTLSSRTAPERKIYRYQLIRSNHQKSNDGILVLEALSPNETLFTEIDFWDANYGIAKSLGVNRIWKDSMQGILQSDLALRIKAENPEWKNERVKKVSEEFSEKFDLEDFLKSRKTWDEVI
ncbi:MAG: hypothetical protein H7222_17320 [Methylotenera sp.]|nr:hypothetical protein [Oligoflexia bacterium]